MASVKLDATLAALVHSARNRVRATEELPERVRVLVHVTGDLRAVEEAGLWVEIDAGAVVTGTIAVEDLERVVESADVAFIGSNKKSSPHLHDSVPRMHGDKARLVPPGVSGRGVIVGIVDSGIDIFHGTFRNPSNGETRIISLLDLTQRHTITISGAVPNNVFGLRWQPPPRPGTTIPLGPPNVTTPIPATATNIQVESALLTAFPSITVQDIEVTGGPLPDKPVVIDFVGRFAPNVYDTGLIGSFTPTGRPDGPVKVIRGREFVPDEINLGLSLPIQPYLSRDISGHGTHVAGIAAGNGAQAGSCHNKNYYVGVAPEADLIVVRTTFHDVENLQGVKHIFDRAKQLGKPAVVNFSQGRNTGPHDGAEAFEVALDEQLADTTKRAIVISAGNDGALLDPAMPVVSGTNKVETKGGGVHARKVVPASTPQNDPITVGVVIADTQRREDKVADLLDIWYLGPGRLEVDLAAPPEAVVPPDAGSFGRVGPPSPPPPKPTSITRLVAGHPVTVDIAQKVAPHDKTNILITIAPGPGGTIAKGEWTLQFWETQGTATAFDCWIETTDDVHPRFALDDQVRTGTVTVPGTAKLPITVGAFDNDRHVLERSARGGTTDGRTKPELCAPGFEITSAKNKGEARSGSWCGCCYSYYKEESGTSEAAPHVTGVVALMLEMKPTLSHDKIKTILMSKSDPPVPNPGLPHGEDGYGAGVVNAEKAVQQAKITTSSAGDEPIVLSPAAYGPIGPRVRRLRARAEQSPTGQLVGALASEHVDEIRRLVDTDRRVLVAWHRMHGPSLLLLLLSDLEPDVPVPARLGGRPVAEGLARFLDALARAGSPELRAAVAEHRELLLGLPGATWVEADGMKAS